MLSNSSTLGVAALRERSHAGAAQPWVAPVARPYGPDAAAPARMRAARAAGVFGQQTSEKFLHTTLIPAASGGAKGPQPAREPA